MDLDIIDQCIIKFFKYSRWTNLKSANGAMKDDVSETNESPFGTIRSLTIN
jgi:hypothetical protein